LKPGQSPGLSNQNFRKLLFKKKAPPASLPGELQRKYPSIAAPTASICLSKSHQPFQVVLVDSITKVHLSLNIYQTSALESTLVLAKWSEVDNICQKHLRSISVMESTVERHEG
jgi:hypothetical protein